MVEFRRDKILPEDLIQRTNLSQHNMMIDAINDIDGRQTDIEHITNINIDDIVDLKTDVIALSNEKLDKDDIDADLHFGDITVTRDGTAVIMSLDVLNPTTNVVTPISFTIPGATSAEAGTMDASSVAWIADAEERISALEGLSDVKAVADLTSSPTQAELTTGWVAVAGKQPETGDILQDINNSKLWVFVGTDWALYGTVVTVPLATTSSIGGVRDTSLTAPGNRWYVHVENDGRLALIGGDSLSTLIDTTIPALQSGKQDKLTFDYMPVSESDNPVRSGGVFTALTGKQNKLTFDNVPVSGSSKPVKSGGVYTALADIYSQVNARILKSEKGAPSGVATLNALGRVPSAQLPSYVGHISMYSNFIGVQVTTRGYVQYTRTSPKAGVITLSCRVTENLDESKYTFTTIGRLNEILGVNLIIDTTPRGYWSGVSIEGAIASVISTTASTGELQLARVYDNSGATGAVFLPLFSNKEVFISYPVGEA